MTELQSGNLEDLIHEWHKWFERGDLTRSDAELAKIYAYVDDLVREARAPLVALLRELLPHVEQRWTETMPHNCWGRCRACLAERTYGETRLIEHTPECPVTRARALLAREGEEPR